MKYIEQYMRPSVQNYDGTIRPVPIVYNGAERWVQVRRRKYLVDQQGNTLYPLISFSRISTQRDPTQELNRIWTMRGIRTFVQVENKYSKQRPYNSLDQLVGRRARPKYINLMLPIPMTCEYQFQIYTDSHQQMNALIQGFFLHDKMWWIMDDYRVKIDFGDFNNTTQIQANTQRLIKSTFSLKTRSTLFPKAYQPVQTIEQIDPQKKFITNLD